MAVCAQISCVNLSYQICNHIIINNISNINRHSIISMAVREMANWDSRTSQIKKLLECQHCMVANSVLGNSWGRSKIVIFKDFGWIELMLKS